MSLKALDWALDQDLRCLNKIVLVILGRYADRQNQCAFTVRQIADKAGMSRRSAQLAVRRLEKSRFIETQRQIDEDGANGPNRFTLLMSAEVVV